MNNENLEKFINYAVANKHNKYLELEARFGSYNKISSNIRKKTFFKIYEAFSIDTSKKNYSFIKDVLYSGDKKKRTVLGDPKLYVKDLFNNKSNQNKFIDDIKDSTDKYSKMETKSNTITLSKTPVFKPIEVKGVMKIVLVIENESNDVISNKSTYIKNKFRCTIEYPSWNIDLTIILILDCKTDKYAVFYEVEIEFRVGNNTKELISDKNNSKEFSSPLANFKKYSAAIMAIIDCAKNTSLETELNYGIFNQVSTLTREYIPKLIHGKYAVTEKADGERYFIYIDDKKDIYKINPSDVIINKILIEKNSHVAPNTLIDGELIIINNKPVFLGFDLLFFDKYDYRNNNLTERLICLQKVVGLLNKKSFDIKFTIKKFYMENIFINAARIWNNRAKLFPYNLDGLIFTPIRGAYNSNLPNLKWKDKHSVDVRILNSNKSNFTGFHSMSFPRTKVIDGKPIITNEFIDHKTGNIYHTGRINVNQSENINKYKQLNLVNNYGDLGISGRLESPDLVRNMADIIELEFDMDQKKWVYLRKRNDKEKPNAYRTIVGVLDAIVDDITINELSKLKYKISPYELMGSKCHTNIGFNFISSDMSSGICDFYKHAYGEIINNSFELNKTKSNTQTKSSKSSLNQSKSILLIGCDICLLYAVSKKYDNILILDSNCLNIHGRKISEGYTGLIEYAENNKIKATIVWGFLNNGLIAYTKKEQNEIKSFMKKTTVDTVFIHSFVDMIYMNDKFDKMTYEKNINLIKKLSQNIIGIYLNGTQILKYLDAHDCILTKNKDLHPLFRIHVNKKPVNKNIFTVKPIDIKMLKVQRLQNSFVTQQQPLLLDEHVQELLSYGKLNPSICKLMSVYNPKYEAHTSEYDKVIADITGFFIIKS
jgi:hypothetical protein